MIIRHGSANLVETKLSACAADHASTQDCFPKALTRHPRIGWNVSELLRIAREMEGPQLCDLAHSMNGLPFASRVTHSAQRVGE
jgi:hypothetical protein